MGEKTLIAVVDDEPVWLTAIGRALSRAGHHSLLLGDPENAAETIVDELPDVVIVDRWMPGLGGVGLVKELRARLGDRCPPVILVSGDLADISEEDDELFALRMEKPISLQSLLEEVRRLALTAKRSGTHAKISAADRAKKSSEKSGR